MKHPNLVLVFADQWRYQASGFGGDANVRTPNVDRLSGVSLSFTTAVSGCPVCSPARASLLTGQYPDEHGVFVNDVCLGSQAVSLADAYKNAGYDTAYIGKWHLDGHGRSNYIPSGRRHGFDFWQVLECTHDYNHSFYYAGEDATRRIWPGYDAEAQTRQAQQYIHEHAQGKPFCLVLSWGPPHNPYDSAPERYARMYDPSRLTLRLNVPLAIHEQARQNLAGYYAHVSALDALIGDLWQTLQAEQIADDTLFVIWSDHGDMLGSQGQWRKQRPWDESIRVPLLVHYPALLGQQGRNLDTPINTPDLMPTILSLSGIPIPATVRGMDYAPHLLGEAAAPADAVLLACYQPFGEYTRQEHGGREYRGLRSRRYTYARDLNGPWLLYDDKADPYQMHNLIADPQYASLQQDFDNQLTKLLKRYNDEFRPGQDYIERWNYTVDATGTVPYTE